MCLVWKITYFYYFHIYYFFSIDPAVGLKDASRFEDKYKEQGLGLYKDFFKEPGSGLYKDAFKDQQPPSSHYPYKDVYGGDQKSYLKDQTVYLKDQESLRQQQPSLYSSAQQQQHHHHPSHQQQQQQQPSQQQLHQPYNNNIKVCEIDDLTIFSFG